jgi:hypothetical protein
MTSKKASVSSIEETRIIVCRYFMALAPRDIWRRVVADLDAPR